MSMNEPVTTHAYELPLRKLLKIEDNDCNISDWFRWLPQPVHFIKLRSELVTYLRNQREISSIFYSAEKAHEPICSNLQDLSDQLFR